MKRQIEEENDDSDEEAKDFNHFDKENKIPNFNKKIEEEDSEVFKKFEIDIDKPTVSVTMI